jgi:TrmH family RNA methyltransferase
MLLDRAVDGPVAIVFGRESSGLNNSELEMCSVHSTVPLATETQSLNLAQAVMVYTNAVFQTSLTPAERQYQPATHEELEQFYQHLAKALITLGTNPANSVEGYVARFRRVISRMPLESRDVRLLRKIFTRIRAIAGVPKGS